MLTTNVTKINLKCNKHPMESKGARSIRPKISENSGSKSNGTELLRKFVSKISVDPSRLSFLEIPEIPCSIFHFFPVGIGPSSFSREKLPDGGKSGCEMICDSSSRDMISWKIVNWWFRISCGSVRPVCILSR